MPEEQVTIEERRWIADLRDRLHSLCQPLTALQCRLEMGRDSLNVSALQSTIDEALIECERLNNGVRAMQTAMRTAIQGTDGTGD